MTVLHDEPRVLVVPATHRLAGMKSITLDDLADEELVACTSTATIWSAARPLTSHPDGRQAPAGPGVGPGVGPGPGPDDSFEDKLEAIAGGHSIAILPAGDRRSTLRGDLATVPVEGIDPCQVVVATRANDPNPLVTAFREAARTHLTGST